MVLNMHQTAYFHPAVNITHQGTSAEHAEEVMEE